MSSLYKRVIYILVLSFIILTAFTAVVFIFTFNRFSSHIENFADIKLKAFTKRLILEKSRTAIGKLEVFLLSKNRIPSKIENDALFRNISEAPPLKTAGIIILDENNKKDFFKNAKPFF